MTVMYMSVVMSVVLLHVHWNAVVFSVNPVIAVVQIMSAKPGYCFGAVNHDKYTLRGSSPLSRLFNGRLLGEEPRAVTESQTM